MSPTEELQQKPHAPQPRTLPNENKPGYKKTKLGWIPEEWEVHRLGDIAFKIGDGLHGTPNYVDDSPYYFINGNNLRNGQILTDENTKRVSEQDFLKNNKDLDDSTLLMSINGTIGNLAFYSGEKLMLGKSAAYIKISSDSKIFLYYLLSSRPVQQFFENELTGSTIRNLGLKSIRLTPVPCPPLPEQRAIARILSTWDKAIATLQKLIAKKQERKKGLMQVLLSGKKRFKGFDGEWKEVRIEDVAKVDARSLGNSTSEDYEFNYISLSDVDKGIVNEPLEKYQFGNAPSRARRIVQKGDILMATVRPNLQAFAYIKRDVVDTIASTGFAVLAAKTKISSEFIYHYLFGKHISSQLHGLIVGSNYPAVNSKEVKRLKVNLPSFEEQQKIASVLSAADGEIEKLQGQLEKLQEQKKGLMQKLLTGEVRVKTNSNHD